MLSDKQILVKFAREMLYEWTGCTPSDELRMQAAEMLMKLERQ